MSLFKKLFTNKVTNTVSPNDDYSHFQYLHKSDAVDFQDLFEQNAGLSFEKQMIFADTIGSNGWQFDMDKGTIAFGELEFPVQVIGSFAYGSSSWMWEWANTQNDTPENLLTLSRKLKQLGDKQHIYELSEKRFNTEPGIEHKIGMLVCGLFDAKAYYCADYGQGVMVITIDDERIAKVDKDKLEKVPALIPQLISAMDLNHKNMIKNYLIDRDFKLKISENKIEGLRNNKILTAEFDEMSRLISLNGKI